MCMKVERSCFLISGVQYIHARLKQESEEIKNIEQKRIDHEESRVRQFEQEKRVMELEKVNTILKRAIKKPRQFDIRHGLNKTNSINYSASFLRLHQKRYACFYEKRSRLQ